MRSYPDAARILGIGLRTLTRLAKRREIEVVEMSPRRRGVTEAALLRYLEARSRPALRDGDDE